MRRRISSSPCGKARSPKLRRTGQAYPVSGRLEEQRKEVFAMKFDRGS
ncbi:MAG: hypothetical protein K2O59_16890 [Lachnospiraceae bacterium]|nr:hypothetical protein [Lachnospiraceae bacterium]